jgi:ribosomal-protein-alanine N-acetyltransferase
VTVIDLDPRWLAACLVLDERALKGFWSAQQWRSELEDPRRLCLGLARDEEGLSGVACGWLVVDELHITVLAVDPDERQRGHGRRLLTALLQRARQDGAAHATLEVRSDNIAALSLYHRVGFKTAGRREKYYRDGSDALIQWRRLSTEE